MVYKNLHVAKLCRARSAAQLSRQRAAPGGDSHRSSGLSLPCGKVGLGEMYGQVPQRSLSLGLVSFPSGDSVRVI